MRNLRIGIVGAGTGRACSRLLPRQRRPRCPPPRALCRSPARWRRPAAAAYRSCLPCGARTSMRHACALGAVIHDLEGRTVGGWPVLQRTVHLEDARTARRLHIQAARRRIERAAAPIRAAPHAGQRRRCLAAMAAYKSDQADTSSTPPSPAPSTPASHQTHRPASRPVIRTPAAWSGTAASATTLRRAHRCAAQAALRSATPVCR